MSDLRQQLHALAEHWDSRSRELNQQADHMDGCNGRPFDPGKRLELRVRAEECAHRSAELDALIRAASPPAPHQSDPDLDEAESVIRTLLLEFGASDAKIVHLARSFVDRCEEIRQRDKSAGWVRSAGPPQEIHEAVERLTPEQLSRIGASIRQQHDEHQIIAAYLRVIANSIQRGNFVTDENEAEVIAEMSGGAAGPQELPRRSAAELAVALRERARRLCGERWEIVATQNMMNEAADLLEARGDAARVPPSQELESFISDVARWLSDEGVGNEDDIREELKRLWAAGISPATPPQQEK